MIVHDKEKGSKEGNAEEKGHATRIYGNKAEGGNGETAREIQEGKKELMNVERREHWRKIPGNWMEDKIKVLRG
jgi:hypothetical protein